MSDHNHRKSECLIQPFPEYECQMQGAWLTGHAIRKSETWDARPTPSEILAAPNWNKRSGTDWRRPDHRGLSGWIVRCARIQREAVAAIKHAGGGTAYDWQMRMGRYVPGTTPWAPRRLTDLIGIDYFCHVTDASVRSRKMFTDETMAHVGRLSRLERLTIESQSLTDAGMTNLTGLTSLSNLDLNNTRFAPAGLRHLAGLTRLTVLDLRFTRVSDDGLAD